MFYQERQDGEQWSVTYVLPGETRWRAVVCDLRSTRRDKMERSGLCLCSTRRDKMERVVCDLCSTRRDKMESSGL